MGDKVQRKENLQTVPGILQHMKKGETLYKQQAFIDFIEFCIDWNIPVSKKDFRKYKKYIVKQNSKRLFKF